MRPVMVYGVLFVSWQILKELLAAMNRQQSRSLSELARLEINKSFTPWSGNTCDSFTAVRESFVSWQSLKEQVDPNLQRLLSALRHWPPRPPGGLFRTFILPIPSDFDTTRRGPDKSLFIMHARDRHGFQNELISQLGHYLLHFLRVQSGPLSINWRWGEEEE